MASYRPFQRVGVLYTPTERNSVVLLEEIRGVQASLIDIDNVEAMRRAVKYLIGQGHTRVVHLAGPPYSMHSEQRVAGVRRAFSESSLIFSDAAGHQTGNLHRDRSGSLRVDGAWLDG